MTVDESLPETTRQWVFDQLAGIASVTDVSWPDGDSRVWLVASDTDVGFLKISSAPLAYEREVHAYRRVAGLLGPHEAPRMIAADPNQRAILTSSLPGSVVRGLALDPVVEPRVHEGAGRLLRRWHDAGEPAPDRSRSEVVKSLGLQADEADECLTRTVGYLRSAESALVRRVSEELPDLAEQLPIVFCHGDFSPRNWLWDAGNATCGLIDFERAGYGVAVTDLVWLCGAVWSRRQDLKEAFLVGYGQVLSDVEQRALPLLTARLAVSYLSTGMVNDDPLLIDRGKTALADLVRTSA